MEEVYVGTKRLCAKIELAPQTIYNWVCQGKLVAGVHYFKVNGKKLLFKLSAIQAWLEGSYAAGSLGLESSSAVACGSVQTAESSADDRKLERKSRRVSAISKGRINI